MLAKRRENISHVIELLQPTLSNIVRAPTYTTKPVGYADQANFLNTVIRGETELSPKDLLTFVKKIEKDVGRIQRFKNGPREIDIDIIFYDGKIVNEPDLQIPHPRFAERDFVLKPLSDLAPDFIDPASGQSVRTLLDALRASDLSILA
jgi:2-amino-4-hydroxy-6-hydroxymethyldihydropteridine diphosphokinase